MGSDINGHGRRLPRMGAAACESYDHGIGARPSGNRLRHRLGQRPGADYRASQRVLFQIFLHPSDSHVYRRRATELDRIRGICGYRSRGRTAFFAGAEARRIEIERLYRQLTEAFDRASEAETLRRSEQLKTALLPSAESDESAPSLFPIAVRSVVTDALMDVSGVRRSCVTASSGAGFSCSLRRSVSASLALSNASVNCLYRRSISILRASASSARLRAREESCPTATAVATNTTNAIQFCGWAMVNV